MDIFLDSEAPLNSDYGNGHFLRSISLARIQPDVTRVALEDHYHAFSILIWHDHSQLLDIRASWRRHPMSACTGAESAISDWKHMPLGQAAHELRRFADSSQQCTHMLDALLLAAAHVQNRAADVRYDIEVADSRDGRQTISFNVNQQCRLTLEVDDGAVITYPDAMRGVSAIRGFARWATESLPAEMATYCAVIQKALFVAQGRRLDLQSTVGKTSQLSGPPTGACFAAQPARYEDSVRIDTTRDFSRATIDQLLRFVE